MAENKKVEDLKFEEALKELEYIVRQLEGGEIDLEESLAKFQRGIELSKHCKTTLAHAEETLTQMVKEDGQVVPFEEGKN